MSECVIPEAEVQQAFLAAPPMIAQQIVDLTVKHPSWLRDVFDVDPWPEGEGTIMQQITIRGEMPQIERDFKAWKHLSNTTGLGAAPCNGPDCSYNMSTLGGHGFDRKVVPLMRREFRSPSYCVNEIQTYYQFKETMAKIMELLFAQIDFFKEQSICMNVLTGIAKKIVVDSDGAKANSQNPYVYRNVGSATLSTLNIYILEWLYEWMRKIPSCVPYTMQNGNPVFALECSHQLLSHMYRDDPNMRTDMRADQNGYARDLVDKYNFTNTVRGMFLPAPILTPRRFNINASGDPEEVLPYVKGVPMEIGSYTGMNPAYEDATHEEVLVHGKSPFKLFVSDTAQSIGGGTDFGPEFSYFNGWKWVNPETVEDPLRRVGFFVTSGTLGVSQQYSEGVFGILVERPKKYNMATFNPVPDGPATPSEIDNSVPVIGGCPCPLILGVSPNPTEANTYFATFAVSPGAQSGGSIQFGLLAGGYVTGTVVKVSSDGLSVEFTLPSGTDVDLCTQFTTVYCDDLLGCYSEVLSVSCCRTGATGYVDVIFKRPIKAVTAADVIYAYMGDGTTQHLSVVSVDMTTNTWTLEYAAGYGPTDDPTGVGATNLEDDLCCDRNGIIAVCVPPTTDATCPSCTDPVVDVCSPSNSPSPSSSPSPSASPSGSPSTSPSSSPSSTPSGSPSISPSTSPSASPSSSPSPSSTPSSSPSATA